MELTVFKERDNCTEKISFAGKTVADLLKFLCINPETVIVVRKDEVVTEDEVRIRKI